MKAPLDYPGCKTVESKKRMKGIELALKKVEGPERNRTTLLAKRLGVTRQTVYYWIKAGEIPITRVKQVSKELGIPPYKLNSLFASED